MVSHLSRCSIYSVHLREVYSSFCARLKITDAKCTLIFRRCTRGIILYRLCCSAGAIVGRVVGRAAHSTVDAVRALRAIAGMRSPMRSRTVRVDRRHCDTAARCPYRETNERCLLSEQRQRSVDRANDHVAQLAQRKHAEGGGDERAQAAEIGEHLDE